MTTLNKNKATTNKEQNPTTAIRVTTKLSKLLKAESEKLNKNKKGSKKITPSDIIELSVSLLEDSHRDQLISKTGVPQKFRTIFSGGLIS